MKGDVNFCNSGLDKLLNCVINDFNPYDKKWIIPNPYIPNTDSLEEHKKSILDKLNNIQPVKSNHRTYHTDTSYVIEVCTPGFSKDQLKIETFNGNTQIQVKGEKTSLSNVKDLFNYCFPEDKFAINFSIPSKFINCSMNIKTSYVNGLLRIEVINTQPNDLKVNIPIN